MAVWEDGKESNLLITVVNVLTLKSYSKINIVCSSVGIICNKIQKLNQNKLQFHLIFRHYQMYNYELKGKEVSQLLPDEKFVGKCNGLLD